MMMTIMIIIIMILTMTIMMMMAMIICTLSTKDHKNIIRIMKSSEILYIYMTRYQQKLLP